jgi:hypothetical protein
VSSSDTTWTRMVPAFHAKSASLQDAAVQRESAHFDHTTPVDRHHRRTFSCPALWPEHYARPFGSRRRAEVPRPRTGFDASIQPHGAVSVLTTNEQQQQLVHHACIIHRHSCMVEVPVRGIATGTITGQLHHRRCCWIERNTEKEIVTRPVTMRSL